MKTLYFHNPGSLDIRGATIAGLSAKDDPQAIGKFGTGLKYAIASILRWNGAVQIETGGKIYWFDTEAITFRGREHQRIIMHEESMDAQPLGFTTHYGSEWEPWQVFRELYSNALDEGGSVLTSATCAGDDNCTLITIHCEQVANCYLEKDIIIMPSRGQEARDNLFYFNAPSSYLYYRNVRVAKHRALCTWNLTEGVSLTEDRSAKNGEWDWLGPVRRFIQECTDRELIRKVVTADESFFEHDLTFWPSGGASEEFLDVVEEEWKRNPKRVNDSAVQVLKTKREHLAMPELVELTTRQQQMLDKARRLLRLTDLNPDSYPCEVRALHKNTLGWAKNNKVILSPQVFEQGTKQVVSTWYEELMHLEHGVADCTYEMQTKLFNLIIGLYEEHVFGEPC